MQGGDYMEENGVWRTVGGRRIFIKDGQDLASAMKESGKFSKKQIEDKKDYNNLSAELDKTDKEVLDYYVMDAGAYDVNYVLRNPEAFKTENDKRAIKSLDNAINKSSLNKDVETYRYISNENVFKDMKVGDVYEDKGFMSTTYNPKTDREDNFQDYRVKAIIKAKEGTKALDVSSIYDKQAKEGQKESEIIFARDTKMKLVKEETIRDKYDEFSRKVYTFEVESNVPNINKNFSTMSRQQLVTLLVEDQIKRGVIKPENKEIQIKARLSGSMKMSKTKLLEYAEKYL